MHYSLDLLRKGLVFFYEFATISCLLELHFCVLRALLVRTQEHLGLCFLAQIRKRRCTFIENSSLNSLLHLVSRLLIWEWKMTWLLAGSAVTDSFLFWNFLKHSSFCEIWWWQQLIGPLQFRFKTTFWSWGPHVVPWSECAGHNIKEGKDRHQEECGDCKRRKRRRTTEVPDPH